MLRMAAVARAICGRRQQPISMATAVIFSHRSNLPTHQTSSIARLPVSSPRCYARTARRSPPPVRRNADQNEESESESESYSEEEEDKMELFHMDDGDDGEESKEWEGLTMDFRSIGKKGDGDAEDREERS